MLCATVHHLYVEQAFDVGSVLAFSIYANLLTIYRASHMFFCGKCSMVERVWVVVSKAVLSVNKIGCAGFLFLLEPNIRYKVQQCQPSKNLSPKPMPMIETFSLSHSLMSYSSAVKHHVS